MLQGSKKALRYALLVAVALCICKSTYTAQAQAIYGSVYGTVTDKTGAAIPNATITVTDESKGTSVQVTSNESGEYTVPNLIPDVYDVKASAAGFAPVENHWNPGLSRHVTEGRPATQCRRRQRKRNCYHRSPRSFKPIARTSGLFLTKGPFPACPSQGRNFASLQLLIPGAQAMGWTQNNAEDAQGSPTVNIQGQHFSGVGYLLDGASNQDPILGQIVINPPLDAVGEAKIRRKATTRNSGSRSPPW